MKSTKLQIKAGDYVEVVFYCHYYNHYISMIGYVLHHTTKGAFVCFNELPIPNSTYPFLTIKEMYESNDKKAPSLKMDEFPELYDITHPYAAYNKNFSYRYLTFQRETTSANGSYEVASVLIGNEYTAEELMKQISENEQPEYHNIHRDFQINPYYVCENKEYKLPNSNLKHHVEVEEDTN